MLSLLWLGISASWLNNNNITRLSWTILADGKNGGTGDVSRPLIKVPTVPVWQRKFGNFTN